MLKCRCEPTLAAYIDHLKSEADRHWLIDPRQSVNIADQIIHLAHEHDCVWHAALGNMARGDGLKYTDAKEEAWETLDYAGKLFLQADDEIGWARTRIGRLWLAVNLSRVDEALNDLPRAVAICESHHAVLYLFRLRVNVGSLYLRLGNFQRALDIYFSALELAHSLDPADGDNIGTAYFNIAATYNACSQIEQANHYYQLAQEPMSRLSDDSLDPLFLHHAGYVDMLGGSFQNALIRLQRARRTLDGTLSGDYADVEVRRTLVQCYLELNRFNEALELALQVEAETEAAHASHNQASMLRLIALAYMGLAAQDQQLNPAYLEAAQQAAEKAEHIFVQQGAASYAAEMHLLYAQIALHHGNYTVAFAESQQFLTTQAIVGDVRVNVMARLIGSRARLEAGTDLVEAAAETVRVIDTTRSHQLTPLRHSAHLTMGYLREKQGHLTSALRHYHAAALIAEKMQRDMTITLRPYFLEDKDAALRAIIRLHLAAGRAEQAFNALERLRSQVFLNYLTNRDQLRWRMDDAESQQLSTELRELRADYQQATTSTETGWIGADGEQAAHPPVQRLDEMERRIKSITEQLYLRSVEVGGSVHDNVPSVRVESIQQQLDPQEVMVEYFADQNNLWAITLDKESAEVHKLTADLSTVITLLDKLRVNIESVRVLGANDPFADALGQVARVIMSQTYNFLVKPLVARVNDYQRLIIVPYGPLHLVPFNALHMGSGYLIECFDLMTLPSAGLLLHHPPRQPCAATVVAYADEVPLPGIAREAAMVQALFGGEVYEHGTATSAALRLPARQVLHIAAHGKYDLLKPELSHIRLADGQLLTDDLLQMDLSYELVVLSACQTGQAKVSGGEELIGLGRGFLYAGAGAVVTTLWSVNDETAVQLMEHFYRALRVGQSKSAALRTAQCAILSARPATHMAFWAAFQLIGHADALSA